MKCSILMLKKLFLFSFFYICTNALFAQQNVTTPYSRFAFGELNNTSLSPYQSLGSASVGLADSFLLNINNPATYSFIVPHKPIFDLGVSAQFVTISSSDANEKSSAGGLKNIVLGLPITKRLGVVAGLTPYSSVGYYMTNTVEEPNIGDVKYEYFGSGGINKVFLGSGFKIIDKPRKKLSVGANASYIFGTITRERKAIYPSTSFYNTRILSNTVVNDFLFDVGIYYKGQVNDKSWFSLGATYSFADTVNASEEFFAHTYDFNGQGDTIEYIDSTKGFLKMPRKIAYGIAYEIRQPLEGTAYRRFVISTQYQLQDWKYYTEVFGDDTVRDMLKNSNNIGFGFQFTPYVNNNISTKIKLWQLTNYRIGARYSNTYLNINDTQLKQYGITFGLGIPLINSASTSMLHIGMEYGKRGTQENGLLLEEYMNFNIGVTISPHRSEGWFFKRKYD